MASILSKRERDLEAPRPTNPVPFRIARVRNKGRDTFTLELIPREGKAILGLWPGQFNLLGLPGANGIQHGPLRAAAGGTA